MKVTNPRYVDHLHLTKVDGPQGERTLVLPDQSNIAR